MKKNSPTPATVFAIEKAGGAMRLGKALGISHQAIGQWRRVPPHRVLQVEQVSGVSRSDLRPDLYPREAAEQPQDRAA